LSLVLRAIAGLVRGSASLLAAVLQADFGASAADMLAVPPGGMPGPTCEGQEGGMLNRWSVQAWPREWVMPLWTCCRCWMTYCRLYRDVRLFFNSRVSVS
jgi:hypothetical protein